MNIQEICGEYPEDLRFIGPKYPGATHFIGPEYPGDLGMSRRFMLDRPLKGLRNVKKVLENSVTEFFVLELSRVRSPGIFCSDRKKSWNFLKKIFLEFREKMEFLEFSGPRIFLSWNVLSGNFLSRDFVSRKILAFAPGCVHTKSMPPKMKIDGMKAENKPEF